MNEECLALLLGAVNENTEAVTEHRATGTFLGQPSFYGFWFTPEHQRGPSSHLLALAGQNTFTDVCNLFLSSWEYLKDKIISKHQSLRILGINT